MNAKQNEDIIQLMREISFVNKDTLELKEEIQCKECPFCALDDGEFIENYQTKQAMFYKFKKCNRCSLIYPYPRPNKSTLESFFKTEEYGSRTKEMLKNLERKNTTDNKNALWFIRDIWRRSPLCYSYQEFERFAKKGYRILDVGAGYGVVAKKLIKKGCTVEVVEMNPYRAKYIRERLGIKIYEEAFEEAQLPQSSYDMIIFSRVLMHLFSLKEVMRKIRYALRPGGLIVSSQTNFNSIIQQTIRSPRPAGKLTAFSICSWFTPESLKKILEKSGFQIMDITFRPSSLLSYLFPEGYPGGYLTRATLTMIDQILKVILIRTGTSDYCAVVAKKLK